MRRLVLALALLASGCAGHGHVEDCFRCVRFVVSQDRESNAAQIQQIYKVTGEANTAQTQQICTAVTTALQSERKVMQQTVASVAPVRSSQ